MQYAHTLSSYVFHSNHILTPPLPPVSSTPGHSTPHRRLITYRNKCDATVPFADISPDEVAIASDLSVLNWIEESSSYICFSEVVAAKRFIRVSRMKAKGGVVV
jgi:hypothetical protein